SMFMSPNFRQALSPLTTVTPLILLPMNSPSNSPRDWSSPCTVVWLVNLLSLSPKLIVPLLFQVAALTMPSFSWPPMALMLLSRMALASLSSCAPAGPPRPDTRAVTSSAPRNRVMRSPHLVRRKSQTRTARVLVPFYFRRVIGSPCRPGLPGKKPGEPAEVGLPKWLCEKWPSHGAGRAPARPAPPVGHLSHKIVIVPTTV